MGFQLAYDVIEDKIRFTAKEKNLWINEFVFGKAKKTISFSDDPVASLRYESFYDKLQHTPTPREDLKMSRKLPWANAIYIFDYGSPNVIEELVYFASSAAFTRKSLLTDFFLLFYLCRAYYSEIFQFWSNT